MLVGIEDASPSGKLVKTGIFFAIES